jgi:hypothetical protein
MKSKVLYDCVFIVICVGFIMFLLPMQHRSWIISPAEEYHGWQFMAVDGSLSFWWLGYGLNHRYTYFQSTNGTIFSCEDFGWSLNDGR